MKTKLDKILDAIHERINEIDSEIVDETLSIENDTFNNLFEKEEKEFYIINLKRQLSFLKGLLE